MNVAIVAARGEAGERGMTTYSWTGTASTDFANAANWLDLDTGAPASVPGAQDTVELSGSGDIAGTGTVSAIDVTNARSLGWTLDGQFASRTVSDLGTLTLSDYLENSAPSQLLAASVSVVGQDSELLVDGARLAGLHGRLDVLVSTANPSGYAEAQLAIGDDDGHGQGLLDLGSGTVTVGDGPGGEGELSLNDGAITGGPASAIIVGKDGAYGDFYNTTNATTLAAGTLILGDSGTGEAVFHDPITLNLGRGYGPALVIGADDSKASATPGSGALDVSSGQTTIDGLAEVGEAGQGYLSTSLTMLTTERGLVIGDAGSAQGTVTLAETAWTDTGNIIVGNGGQGSLQITALNGIEGPYGLSTIDGDVQIGVRGGSGDVTLGATTLTVAGNTVLGASSLDTISLKGSEWDSAGHGVRLLAASAGQQGSTFSIGQDSSLIAGELTVGQGARVEASEAGTLSLGSSASGRAGFIDGLLVVAQGSTLTGLGNLAVAHSSYSGSNPTGLILGDGGAISLTASSRYALSLVGDGMATVQGGTLTADGGILAASQGRLLIEGGTVTAASSRVALDVAGNGSVFLQSGQLDTIGELSINASDRRPGESQPGTLSADFGASLSSSAATPGGLAVAIDGGLASLYGATWTIDGRAEVGALGHYGTLTAEGAVVDISGALMVGGARSYGMVSTSDTDTVISGGSLAAGQTGIAAASIVVGGDGSSITTGTLDIGTALTRGDLTIKDGDVTATGSANLNGVLRLSDRAELHADTINLEAHSAILGSGTLVASDIIVQGDIIVTHGSLVCLGPVTGAGVLHLSDATLQLTQSEAASVGISFGAAGTIVTPSIADLAGKLSGWQAGDAILFSGQAIASDSYANGTLSLFDSSQTLLGTEMFRGALSAGNFVLTSEQGTATLLSYHG